MKISRIINRAIHKHEKKQCADTYTPSDYLIVITSAVHVRKLMLVHFGLLAIMSDFITEQTANTTAEAKTIFHMFIVFRFSLSFLHTCLVYCNGRRVFVYTCKLRHYRPNDKAVSQLFQQIRQKTCEAAEAQMSRYRQNRTSR